MALDWGAIGVAALQGLSSMSQGSAARQGSKEDWKNRLEEMRMQINGQLLQNQQARQYQLQDRAYNRAQVQNYSQFAHDPVAAVAPIDTTATMPTLPVDLQMESQRAASTPVAPKKKKKKRGFLSRLFG